MKIKIRILRRDRTVATIQADPDRRFLKFKDGLYVVSGKYVNNGPDGPETLFFEGSSTPLNPSNEDGSSAFMDDVVMSNFLDQVRDPELKGGLGLGWLKDLISNPQNIVLALLVSSIIYAIFAGGFRP